MTLRSRLACGDLRGLSALGDLVRCRCARGRYLDDRLHAEVHGAPGIMLGTVIPLADAGIAAQLADVAAGGRRALRRGGHPVAHPASVAAAAATHPAVGSRSRARCGRRPMSDAELPLLESWRIEVDDRDETVIVGTVDGQLVGGPMSSIDAETGIVRTKNGEVCALRSPDPVAGDDPYSPPVGHQARRMARLEAALARIAAGDVPDDAELAAAPIIEGWAVAVDDDCPVIVGFVHGHPRVVDGCSIITSPVVWVADGRRTARTVSR